MSCTFDSQVFDAARPELERCDLDEHTPTATSLVIRVRTGNSPTPMRLVQFQHYRDSGDRFREQCRYSQYRAVIDNRNDQTPVLRDVTLSYRHRSPINRQ